MRTGSMTLHELGDLIQAHEQEHEGRPALPEAREL